MQEQEFWAIVEAARSAAGDEMQQRPDTLQAHLETLEVEEIRGFQAIYDALIGKSNRWDLWGAANLMNGGRCTDDGFRYFCDWLISEGRKRFERALADADSLVEVPAREYFDLELFAYAATLAYEVKGAGELECDPSGEFAAPAGTKWKRADLPAMFPRLAAKYRT